MTLVEFEREAVAHLLNYAGHCAISPDSLRACSVINYEYTSGGYFIECTKGDLLLEDKTWHEPVIFGRNEDVEVGFLLYTHDNSMTLECHGWGGADVPVNVRAMNLDITVE